MSLSATQVVDRVLREAREKGIILNPDDIEQSIPTGLQMLADQVAVDPLRRAKLQKSFQVAMVNGIADLETAVLEGGAALSTAGVSNILIGTIERMKHSGHPRALSQVINETDLFYPVEYDFYWRAWLGNNGIEATDFNGTHVANGTVIFTAGCSLTLAGLTALPELTDDFIVLLVSLGAKTQSVAA